MDKLENYCQIIQKILADYQQWATGANQPWVQQCVAFDERRDRYFWFHLGWDDKPNDDNAVVPKVKSGCLQTLMNLWKTLRSI